MGNAVRVRSGVTDPDFPDIPLGGWAGTITDVEDGDPPLYFIRWSQDTLKNMHPVYRKRSERDGLDWEDMWLGEDDLEADAGSPVILEKPTTIATPPLSITDQDDRIRTVFGLTKDDPLPDVDEASLRIYYKYLGTNLKCPFEATWARESGLGEMSEKVTVLALGGFENEPWIDDTYGILCKAKISGGEGELPLAETENQEDHPHKQMVDDYACWFWNHR